VIVGHVGPLDRVHLGVSGGAPYKHYSMCRLRPGAKTKTDTGAGTTALHTEHDDQSETDTQSQFSEEAYTPPKVVSSKAKNGRHFYSKPRFMFPLGVIRDYHHITLFSGSAAPDLHFQWASFLCLYS
jgi:hypothetical protein